MRNEFLRVRVDGKVRAEARNILAMLGVTEGDAIAMLLSQICLHRKLPFTPEFGDRYKEIPIVSDPETMRFVDGINRSSAKEQS